MVYCFSFVCFFGLFLSYFKANCDIIVVFFCFTAWFVKINNSWVAVFNMLATRQGLESILISNSPLKLLSFSIFEEI